VFSGPLQGQVVLRHGTGSECLKTQLALFGWTENPPCGGGLDKAEKTALSRSTCYLNFVMFFPFTHIIGAYTK